MENPSTADMEKRYKAWVDALANMFVSAIKIGEDLAGDAYMQRLEDELRARGRKSGKRFADAVGVQGTEADCVGIGKVLDCIDDTMGNWWDGYVENSPEAFEKHIVSCPVAKAWSEAPEICQRLIAADVQGIVESLNPKATVSFHELLTTGDKTCHYRVEIED